MTEQEQKAFKAALDAVIFATETLRKISRLIIEVTTKIQEKMSEAKKAVEE